MYETSTDINFKEESLLSALTFIQRHITYIRGDGRPVAMIARMIKLALGIPVELPLYALAVPAVIVIRLIRPWLLIRFAAIISSRIGHFAANTEIYLCERDAGINVPQRTYIDLFYLIKPVCNNQLAIMWARVLYVWPSWILVPISRINRMIPGWETHDVGMDPENVRDVHNLLDRFPPHLEFTAEEDARGEDEMRALGIPSGTPFVCLNVRDSAYLTHHIPNGNFDYHNYRDCNIQNYVLAAEELADNGYFVIRMGAKVREAMKTAHPRIIDYAMNGMRTDFMDIFLGSKCEFCISTGTGWETIPAWLFRKPTIFSNLVPVGYMLTFSRNFLVTTKKHISKEYSRELTISEIFEVGAGFCMSTDNYECKGIELIENTSEEIRDVVFEMAERLKGTWQPHENDEALQRRFWEVFPTDAVDVDKGRPLHGEIRARFGTDYLRNNRDWLQ